ncbi:cytochrome c oxidase assembly factor Coa1 family protein [Flavobacterium hungaricum]|uniref:Cytochrome oxidase complex assembly protein 1 n=1 Tax=Flavobacterium hungaricum TaxID=2082725 RepID=A0ABR9TRP2_9FLAO|nr:cytochrome c oxidase assembly factor Coa1 family protein [Flavobacterium hungaricum]MBE8727297.1 hypothetical protein [Flavobacterium hungaricum]
MSDELIQHKNWLKRNWKWLFPISGLSILILLISIVPNSGEVIISTTKAYTETALYEDIVKKINSDKEVVAFFGTVQPLDKLALLEGNAVYSNNYNTIIVSVRINGSQRKGKLNFEAVKNKEVWKYTKITILDKITKRKIIVLNSQQRSF